MPKCEAYGLLDVWLLYVIPRDYLLVLLSSIVI